MAKWSKNTLRIALASPGTEINDFLCFDKYTIIWKICHFWPLFQIYFRNYFRNSETVRVPSFQFRYKNIPKYSTFDFRLSRYNFPKKLEIPKALSILMALPPTLPSYLFVPNQSVGNLNPKGNQLNPLTTLTRKGYYESVTLEPGGLEPVWGLIWGV